MRIKTILAATFAALILMSCVTPFDYSAFKESRPRSILVMPPVNKTVDVSAPMPFLVTSTVPLAESGYYVIPVTMSSQTFIQNGITIADEAHLLPHARLRQIFGADAALYITVLEYGSIMGRVYVIAEGKLVNLRTGVELWNAKIRAEEDGALRTSGFGLIGALATVAVNQIVNVLTDKAYDVGKKANNMLLSADTHNGILYGPYHPKYDGE